MQKEIGLQNLKVHYIWTFFSSILFLSPVVSVFYSVKGLSIKDILLLGSVYTILCVILEIPTSTLGDNFGRVKTLIASVCSTFVGIAIYFLYPTYFMFFIATFFSALGQALWSGTGQAKLQEDLKAAEMTSDFGKIIGKLIALQRVGQLITPVVIFSILKFLPNNGYTILAGLDFIIWIFVIFFVSRFKEIDTSYKIVGKSFTHNIKIQFDTLLEAGKYILGNKKLLEFSTIMILSGMFFYVSTVFFPNLYKMGISDYYISILVWIIGIAMILGSYKAHIFGEKFGWKNIFTYIGLFYFILSILFFIFFKNIFASIFIYILMAFIASIYGPTRQHIFMELTDIRAKATTRSLIMSVYFLYQSLILFIGGFVSVNIGVLIVGFMSLLGFLLAFALKFKKD